MLDDVASSAIHDGTRSARLGHGPLRHVLRVGPDALELIPGTTPRTGPVDEFHARGDLLMVGTFAIRSPRAMAVFRTREAAEEFVADDPFVTGGAVRWYLREWNEAFSEL